MGGVTDHLPAVRGRLIENQSLAAVTWFRVGGAADVLFMPADAEDLTSVLAGLPSSVPITLVGVGSNLLIRDGGVEGVVIRLGRPFAAITPEGPARLRVGAGALDATVAKAAQDHGIGGLEFFSGIPGSIGGALRMNAGAYGRETKDVLVEAVAIDRSGGVHVIPCADMGFAYRHAAAPEDLTFIEAVFEGTPDDPEAINARMTEIAASRAATQPIKSRTGGSTFKNPDGEKAWKLIDAAGCRGLTLGDAQVSELHCNFLINRGAATAADLEGLGEEVRRRVAETSGITLAWEIKRLGRPH